MLKKLLISLPMFFVFTGVAFAGNIGNFIYAVYSEVFIGATIESGTDDRVNVWAWDGGGAPSVTNSSSYDGTQYLNNLSAGGWGLFFVNSGGAGINRDMSSYYNGTLEMYIRAPAGANISGIQIGFKANNQDRVKFLSADLSYTPNGQWKKVVIPITSAAFSTLTQTDLVNTSGIFMVQSYGSDRIDIDCVVWKKNSLLVENIGSNPYGVYSEIIPGASPAAANNDKVSIIGPTYISFQNDKTAYEGLEYLKTAGAGGTWAYEFVNASNVQAQRNMSAYYGGSIEFHVRVPVASVNFNNVKFGFQKYWYDYWANVTLADMGVTNDGQWHKVSLPLTSASFTGLNSATDLATATRLFQMQNQNSGSIDIDNIVWNRFVEPPVQIGNDVYGVYSERTAGASPYTTTADRIFKASWDGGGGDQTISSAAYEGSEYLRTGTAGGWGYHFSNTSNAVNPQNMSAYYNGALEFYIRVSTGSAKYGNIKIGIQTVSGGQKSKSLSELGYKSNGQWQLVSIPISSIVTSAADLNSTQFLFLVSNYGSDRVDIDDVVWRKTASQSKGNKSSALYGVYSEWTSGVQFGVSGLDNVASWNWGGSGAAEINSQSAAFEGYKYFSSLSGSGEWGIFFVNNAQNQEVAHSMSEFFNGTLEFFIKAPSGANIGAIQVGIKYNNGDNFRTLSSLGYNSGTGKWQKVSIPLNSSGFSGLAQAVMLESVTGLFRVNNNGQALDIDHVVWKKSSSAPVASMTLNLKNRTDNGVATKITWDAVAINSSTKTVAAKQYLEIQLSDWFPGDVSVEGWGIQIYTDNSGAQYQYSGEMTTNTVTGLVSGYPGDKNYYLPMSWRVSDQLFPIPEPEDPSLKVVYSEWMEPWSNMRDIGAGNSYYNHHEYIRFADKRGYKWSTTEPYGPLNANKILRIYFLVDFTSAKRNRVYKNDTITIELFYE